MNANAILDTLGAALDTATNTLSATLNAAAKAAMSNVHGAEWTSALFMAFSVWLLVNRRRSAAMGFMLFTLAVSAGAWLSWKTGHTGVLMQQIVLAALGLHGLLKSRGWALVKGGRA